MKRTEVLERLEPLTHTQVRQVEHSPGTRVLVTPETVMLRPGSGGHLMPLNENGVKALAGFIGMPQNMGNRLTPDTFGRAATELLARKERYNLLIEEGQVRDFAEYRGIRAIQPERVVSTIERTIPKADYNRVLLFNDYSAAIEIVGERQQPVARGDLVRAGAMVTFSPIGTVVPMVQSFAMRLACTNGVTTNDIIREFHFGGGGEGDDIWQWFRESLTASYRALGDIVSRQQELRNERIPAGQRPLLLEAMLREAHITGEDADVVRARAIEEPPRNMYELLNHITWASSHLIRESARVRQAQTAAATFTSQEEHAQLCPLCHRMN